jgi:hypothetical protein
MKKDTKKVVLLIVEGPSDESSLSPFFKQLFDKENVLFKVVHGDITTKEKSSSNNIVRKVTEEVKSFADKNGFSKNDFLKVIHIVDTDGAFISNDKVILNQSIVKEDSPKYYDNKIECLNKKDIEERNKQKQGCLITLYKTKAIWGGIPYSVFYMSCNLEHVLHNENNLADKEKRVKAYEFSEKFKNNFSDFVRFICLSEFAVKTNYLESWEYIQKECNSLKRHTNIDILFKDQLI